ncbi:hypothetical protein D3C84_917170 [compost metagenome]
MYAVDHDQVLWIQVIQEEIIGDAPEDNDRELEITFLHAILSNRVTVLRLGIIDILTQLVGVRSQCHSAKRHDRST